MQPSVLEARRRVMSVISPQYRLEAMQAAGQGATAVWQPNPDHEDGTPNPQRLALESKADELFYGGQAGGGKTDLGLGAALTKHRRSAIFRRVYPNLDAIEQRLIELVGRNDYNQSRRIYQKGNRRIELESCQRDKDKFNQQGRPRDLYVFDELPEFEKGMYQFIIGWNRSEVDGQRCRVICTGNAPMEDSSMWVVTEWGPWLDPHHPKHAKPGELRWYYYDENDNPIWLDEPKEVTINGRKIVPKSRTFIPASLDDNPYYGDEYLARILSMPEPIRSAMLGDFNAARKVDPYQVIPTAWVKAAQRRWLEREEPDMPLSGVGVDLVRGGVDKFALAKRKGNYYPPIVTTPGVNIEDGPAAALAIHEAIKDDYPNIGYMNLDILGVGTSGYDSTKAMYPDITHGINAGAGSDYIVKFPDGKPMFRMRNVRAAYHWQLREVLDPQNGRDVALPPGNEIVADLCAARYKPLAGGIGKDRVPAMQIEAKEDIRKRIGRSPDVGEAIMLANYEPQKSQPMTEQPQQQSRFSGDRVGSSESGAGRWKRF